MGDLYAWWQWKKSTQNSYKRKDFDGGGGAVTKKERRIKEENNPTDFLSNTSQDVSKKVQNFKLFGEKIKDTSGASPLNLSNF